MNFTFSNVFRPLVGLLATLFACVLPCAALDDTFALIQTKTGVYTNVTVTTKTKDLIVFQHAGGLMSIKPAELNEDSYRAMGFGQKKASGGSFTIAAKARALVESIPAKKIEAALGQFTPSGNSPLAVNAVTIGASIGLVYLIFSYCAMRICQKVGSPAGILAWIPIFQMGALLRAAKMSPAWLLAFVIPILNIWAHILWSVKISKARGKGFITALCLIFPLSLPFAFLYLASAEQKEQTEAQTEPERLRASGLVFETT